MLSKTKKFSAFLLFLLSLQGAVAQRGDIQFFRPYDRGGVNVFENSKSDTLHYDGLKLRVGANFTQGFQALSHSNSSGVPLYNLGNGFPLAQANLNIDVQVAEGVRVGLVSYMSSHKHNEFWVKGGYVQVDKVGFLNMRFLEKLWTNLTLKVGHMEINYGDAHFRRSDGGNTLWNPFMENNIIDAFTTEIGGELYWQKKGFILMGGMTNGEIQGSVEGSGNRSPSIYGKVGFDKAFTSITRIRLTGSILTKSSSLNGTLFSGDRTGSNYQYAMEPVAATLSGNAFSGRVNPGFSDNVTTFVLNPFLKLSNLELFGTFEFAQGSTAIENGEKTFNATTSLINKQTNRQFSQFAADALYRFGEYRQFYVGARYNLVNAQLAFWNTSQQEAVRTVKDVSVERTAFAAGWFMTPNVLLKGEYVIQNYKNYPGESILAGGNFNGFVFQGSIGF